MDFATETGELFELIEAMDDILCREISLLPDKPAGGSTHNENCWLKER